MFVSALLDNDSTLFSADDPRTRSKLILVHSSYLCIEFLLIRIALLINPQMPLAVRWVDRRGGSWFDLILIAVVMVVFFVEKDWLAAAKAGKRRTK